MEGRSIRGKIVRALGGGPRLTRPILRRAARPRQERRARSWRAAHRDFPGKLRSISRHNTNNQRRLRRSMAAISVPPRRRSRPPNSPGSNREQDIARRTQSRPGRRTRNSNPTIGPNPTRKTQTQSRPDAHAGPRDRPTGGDIAAQKYKPNRLGSPDRRWPGPPGPRLPIRTQRLANPNPTPRPPLNNPNPTSSPIRTQRPRRREAGGRTGIRPNRQGRRRYYRDPGDPLTHNLQRVGRISRPSLPGRMPDALTCPGKARQNGLRPARKTTKSGRFSVEMASKSIGIDDKSCINSRFASQRKRVLGVQARG